MPRVRVWVHICTWLLLLLGCEAAPPSTDRRLSQDVCRTPEAGFGNGFLVRDSAPATIVENWPSGRTPTLHLVPTFTIDPGPGLEADLSGRIAAAVLTSHGEVVLADSMSSQVVLFDAAGRLARVLARRGRGPGEFERIQGILRLPGDTLGVIDWDGGRRLTRIMPDGALIDSRLLPFQALARGEHTATPHAFAHLRFALGAFRDGSILASVRPQSLKVPPPSGQGKYHYDSMYVQRVGPTAGEVQELAYLPQKIVYSYVDESGALWSWWAPFSAVGAIAVAGEAWYYAWGERHEIVRHSPSGEITLLIRLCVGRQPVTDEEIARWQRPFLARTTKAQERRLTQAAFDHVAYPAARPAFTHLLVQPDGWLWAGEYHLEDEPQRWWVLDSEGRLLAAAEAPAGMRLVDVGPGYALGILTDRDDVQSVVAARWEMPGLP